MKTYQMVLAGAALLIGAPVGLSYIGAFNSAATAPSRVVQRTLGTDNILQNYELFFDTNAAYKSRVSQIRAQEKLVKAETDHDEHSRLTMEVGAMRQTCRDLANNYNANSQKQNRALFKARDLPVELDANTCEEQG